jgi:hypothetical protein
MAGTCVLGLSLGVFFLLVAGVFVFSLRGCVVGWFLYVFMCALVAGVWVTAS